MSVAYVVLISASISSCLLSGLLKPHIWQGDLLSCLQQGSSFSIKLTCKKRVNKLNAAFFGHLDLLAETVRCILFARLKEYLLHKVRFKHYMCPTQWSCLATVTVIDILVTHHRPFDNLVLHSGDTLVQKVLPELQVFLQCSNATPFAMCMCSLIALQDFLESWLLHQDTFSRMAVSS